LVRVTLQIPVRPFTMGHGSESLRKDLFYIFSMFRLPLCISGLLGNEQEVGGRNFFKLGIRPG